MADQESIANLKNLLLKQIGNSHPKTHNSMHSNGKDITQDVIDLIDKHLTNNGKAGSNNNDYALKYTTCTTQIRSKISMLQDGLIRKEKEKKQLSQRLSDIEKNKLVVENEISQWKAIVLEEVSRKEDELRSRLAITLDPAIDNIRFNYQSADCQIVALNTAVDVAEKLLCSVKEENTSLLEGFGSLLNETSKDALSNDLEAIQEPLVSLESGSSVDLSAVHIRVGSNDEARKVSFHIGMNQHEASKEEIPGQIQFFTGFETETMIGIDGINFAATPPTSCRTISTKGMFSKVPEVNGLDVDAGGNVLVADRESKAVKLYDSHFKKKWKYLCDVSPWNVVFVENTAIAVSEEYSPELILLSRSGKLIRKIVHGVVSLFPGLAYSQGNLMLCDSDNHRIVIMDVQDAKKDIQYFNLDASDYPRYVHVTDQRIIVSSYIYEETSHITVYTLDGQIVFTYGSFGRDIDQFEGTCGVSSDSAGNILVADRGNSRIHLLTADGDFIGYLLNEENGLRNPQAIVITASKELVVSEWHHGKIKVYAS